MSEAYYNEQLYPLQDQVLELVGKTNTSFYLTGGTVLGRYLLKHRYSDDLYFFINRSDSFFEQVSLAMSLLYKNFKNVELSSKQEDYNRYFINEGGVRLKIEFVNDIRRGSLERQTTGTWIDTWQNILSNKITALSRLEGKDYVDILFLSLKYQFNWESMINDAKEKDTSINEIDVSERLMNFNFQSLDKVQFSPLFDKTKIKKDFFFALAKDSLHGFNNSLYRTKL